MTTVYERFYDMTPEGQARAELDVANEAGNRLMDAYNALRAENAALRAERDVAQTRCDEHERDAGYWHYRALQTEAELDALKAAQGWQPGSIRPPAPDWYQTAETADVFSHAYFDGVAWLGYPGNQPPMWYRLIPPLPTAPDQEVQP